MGSWLWKIVRPPAKTTNNTWPPNTVEKKNIDTLLLSNWIWFWRCLSIFNFCTDRPYRKRRVKLLRVQQLPFGPSGPAVRSSRPTKPADNERHCCGYDRNRANTRKSMTLIKPAIHIYDARKRPLSMEKKTTNVRSISFCYRTYFVFFNLYNEFLS